MAMDTEWVKAQDLDKLRKSFETYKAQQKKEGAHSSAFKLSTFLNQKFEKRSTDDRRGLANLMEGRDISYKATRGAGKASAPRGRRGRATGDDLVLSGETRELVKRWLELPAEEREKIADQINHVHAATARERELRTMLESLSRIDPKAAAAAAKAAGIKLDGATKSSAGSVHAPAE